MQVIKNSKHDHRCQQVVESEEKQTKKDKEERCQRFFCLIIGVQRKIINKKNTNRQKSVNERMSER